MGKQFVKMGAGSISVQLMAKFSHANKAYGLNADIGGWICLALDDPQRSVPSCLERAVLSNREVVLLQHGFKPEQRGLGIIEAEAIAQGTHRCSVPDV